MSGATGGQIGWLLAVAILCLSAGSGALVEAGSRRLSAANNKLQLCPSYFLIG